MILLSRRDALVVIIIILTHYLVMNKPDLLEVINEIHC